MDNIEHLATMAAKGDRSAFEELYRKTCKSVYFTCLSFLKDEEEAKDATQDIYLTVLKNLPGLNDKSKFVAWLNRITVNKCMNMLAKKKPVLIDDSENQNLLIEENENFLPEDYITIQAKRKIVMDIINNSLSDVLRQTVIMYYFNEMTAAEIAEVMECPVGTVTYRLSAARARIKEGVLEYENINDDRLHVFAVVPLLASLLTAEVQSMEMPDIFSQIISVAPQKVPYTKIPKGGAKAAAHSLKAKMIAGVIAVAVVGGGIAAAIAVSNNKENPKSEIIGDSSQSEITEEKNDTADQSAEDGTEEITTGAITATETRWLLQQDFSGGQITGNPENFTLLPENLAAPISIDDIKKNYNACTYDARPSGAAYNEEISGSAEEILSSDAVCSVESTPFSEFVKIFLENDSEESLRICIFIICQMRNYPFQSVLIMAGGVCTRNTVLMNF